MTVETLIKEMAVWIPTEDKPIICNPKVKTLYPSVVYGTLNNQKAKTMLNWNPTSLSKAV